MPARGVFARTHQEVFLRSCDLLASPFAKKATSRFAHKVASQPVAPQRIGVFFVSFLLRLLCQKKAEFRIVPYKTAVTLHKDTQAVNPLFLFAKRGTKRKSSQKEKCRLGSFAHCDERQGLMPPLTGTHWRGGSDGFARTHR